MTELDQPLRLFRKQGRWALEVTRLVAVDRDVLRPERRRVSGADSVVRHLKERCAPACVRDALSLIAFDDDGADRTFELDGERWVQLHDDSINDAETSVGELLNAMRELRAELMTLRAMHEAMRARVAVLERRSQHLPAPDYARGALRSGSRREGAASLRPAKVPSLAPDDAREQLGAAKTQASVGASANLVGVALGAPAIHRPPAEAPAPAEIAARPQLAMPAHADIVSCMKQLLGADPELRQEKGNVPKDLDAFYVSRVVDAADQEVGAILLDLSAGVELGGRLLGFPIAALREQLAEEPNGDMLDAMNEVTNNLGGFINRANPDIRVRVRALTKFTSAEFGWLAKNAARVGCTAPLGGRLWIATR